MYYLIAMNVLILEQATRCRFVLSCMHVFDCYILFVLSFVLALGFEYRLCNTSDQLRA